jgi:predicted transcriptional regulator of viral defense system
MRFFVDGKLGDRPVTRVTSTTSMVRVATRETTAFDLVERPGVHAGLSHVATVLAELSPLDPDLLAAQVPSRSVHVARRLGWLLERSGNPVDLGPLYDAVAGNRAAYSPLDPRAPVVGTDKGSRDRHWRVVTNAEVEPDEF